MSWLSSLTGVHISPQHGFSVEPGKVANNLMALSGNPLAIAGAVGNAAHAVAPNSGIGKLGQTAETVGGTLAGLGVGGGGGIINNLKNVIGLGGAGASTDDGYGGVAGDSASTMDANDAAGGGSGPLGDIYKAVNGVISIPRPDEPASQQASGNRGGNGGILNTITSHLTNGNGGLSNPVLLGLAGAEGVMGAKAYGRMGTLQDKALSSVENAYNERAPLRTQGLSMMQNTLAHPVNAQATFADPGNPYSRPPIQLPTSQPAQPAPQIPVAA